MDQSQMSIQFLSPLPRRHACIALTLCILPIKSFTLDKPRQMKTFAEFAGEYREGHRSLVLGSDGSFTWKTLRFPAGTDAGLNVTLFGRAALASDALELVADPQTLNISGSQSEPTGVGSVIPATLYVVEGKGRTFLLDMNQINALVNGINGYGQMSVDAAPYLRKVASEETQHASLQLDAKALIPERFMRRVLREPLNGTVLMVNEIDEKLINVAAWMQPPIWRTQFSAKIVVDLGATHGIFEGMHLYIRDVRRYGIVQFVEINQCAMTMAWIGGIPPKAGDVVSSELK